MQALLIRLHPTGPWRYGPSPGGADRLDDLYRSDRLYSAVTLAMKQLGWLDEWLTATALDYAPEVVLSSLFPFQGDTLFAIPPATLWPPPAAFVTAPSPVFLSKIRWSSARFVPLTVIDSLLIGQPILAEQWLPDPTSGCLLRRDRPSSSPFRVSLRTTAAVDRESRVSTLARETACAEFEPGAGLWCVAGIRDQSEWRSRLQAAFRLIADTGLGGHRTSGWGQMQAPEFRRGSWPEILLPKMARAAHQRAVSNGSEEPKFHWLLSLYSPGPDDGIDWKSGRYQLTMRGGHMEHLGASKKLSRFVSEGSVLVSSSEIRGSALDVAPEGSSHPVYRSGLALSIHLVQLEPVATEAPAETPATPEAIEPTPCEEPAEAREPESLSRPETEPEALVPPDHRASAEPESVEPQPVSQPESEPPSEI